MRELLVFGLYFLMLSTVLQSEDAFVFFSNSEQGGSEDAEQPTRGARLFIYFIFAVLYYLTLLVTPYINLNLRQLSMAGCGIILAKYIFELLAYAHIMTGLLELSAMVCDTIGQSVFYLASLRVIQVICEKHGMTGQIGKLFAIFASIYALSIIIGYALSYACFRVLYTWSYLIVLTCITILAGMVCYFAFPMEMRPTQVSELHEEKQDEPSTSQPPQAIHVDSNGNPLPRPNNASSPDSALITRDGMPLLDIMTLTLAMYKKMLLIIGVQMTLGVFISYTLNLIEYLIWTTQNTTDHAKLIHNLDGVLILGGGAMLMSFTVGLLCDQFTMKKVGFIVTLFATGVFLSLYIGIAMQSLYTTYFLLLFVGMALFGIVVWLLCACSKIFGGKFEAFAVAAQFVGVAMFFYDMLWIVFEGRV